VPAAVLAAGLPMGAGYALKRWAKAPVAGSYVFLSGIVLAILSVFRWAKPRIPYVAELNLGPLGNVGPGLFEGPGGCLFYMGADGAGYEISGLDPGPMVEVLVDGERVAGSMLGELVLPSGSAFLLRTPGGRNVALPASAQVARQLAAQGAELGAVWRNELGAVWRNELGAVWSGELSGGRFSREAGGKMEGIQVWAEERNRYDEPQLGAVWSGELGNGGYLSE